MSKRAKIWISGEWTPELTREFADIIARNGAPMRERGLFRDSAGWTPFSLIVGAVLSSATIICLLVWALT